MVQGITRGKKTYVYKGKYALVGADATSTSRVGVRSHVELPYGDLDRFSRPIPPECVPVRNRRVESRLQQQEEERIRKEQPQIRATHSQKSKYSLSKRGAYGLLLVFALFLGGMLLSQHDALAQKEAAILTLNNQIERQSETNATLQDTLAEASDEVKIRYQAVQRLGMTSPKGVESIEVVAPQTRVPSANIVIPENAGVFASLFALLN